MLKWVIYYYKNKNLDIVTYKNSLRIHDLLDDIKCRLISNQEIGMASMLSDDILNRYGVIIKLTNDERDQVNGKK